MKLSSPQRIPAHCSICVPVGHQKWLKGESGNCKSRTDEDQCLRHCACPEGLLQVTKHHTLDLVPKSTVAMTCSHQGRGPVSHDYAKKKKKFMSGWLPKWNTSKINEIELIFLWVRLTYTIFNPLANISTFHFEQIICSLPPTCIPNKTVENKSMFFVLVALLFSYYTCHYLDEIPTLQRSCRVPTESREGPGLSHQLEWESC